MTRAMTIIGPQDHGRRMTLDEFDQAEGQEGHLYELGRREVIVVDVPEPDHEWRVDLLRQQLDAYRQRQPTIIHMLAAGTGCKLLIEDYESERHPDLAIYKTPPPVPGKDVWSIWIPEIVAEVVSASSRQRDYEEKPEEYLAFGVQEYWIIDAAERQVLALRRHRGRWSRHPLRPGQSHRTHLLPGFELDIAAVLEAAKLR